MLDVSQFKPLFLSEAEDHIQAMNENLLMVEKQLKSGDQPSKDLLNELMRSAHTMKSSSATMGFKRLAFVMHVMEDVFDFARHDMLVLSLDAVSLLFETIDAIDLSVESISNKDQELPMPNLPEKLKQFTGVATEGTGKSKRTESGAPIIQSAQQSDAPTETPATMSDLTVSTHVRPMTSIKVPVNRVDNLFDLVEELLIDRMRLASIVDPKSDRFVNLSDKQMKETYPLIHEIAPVVEHMTSLVSALQHQVMQVRLVPLNQIFGRFPRMVRDLAKKQNKEVEFAVEGGDLELDRSVVDTLAQPLVHLLRNAVDHGVEKKGVVTLRAAREKNVTIISVEDNGRGIPWNDVIESALHRKIVSAPERDRLLTILSEREENGEAMREVEKLIFHPQLSTSVNVTETSGRGVGMSVVETFVKEISGRLRVHSPLPKGGTRISLSLPLSLAITNALLVTVRGRRFAIPFISIERSVKLTPSSVKSMADQDVGVVDGIEVPLIHLSSLFADSFQELDQANLDQKRPTKDKGEDTLVVLVHHGESLAGLVVDELSEGLEIVVKGLPPVLKGMKGFSGSTILGDGNTVLIIDIPTLLEDQSRFIRTQ